MAPLPKKGRLTMKLALASGKEVKHSWMIRVDAGVDGSTQLEIEVSPENLGLGLAAMGWVDCTYKVFVREGHG
jgi:hypothetical protein